MMKTIIIASNNDKKILELTALCQGLPYQFQKQSDYNVTPIAETGLTFIENALIKARHASQATGLAALADDSGLIVDALNGAPGIYSARYAGPDATDEQNNNKLLASLQNVSANERQARYVCVIVYLKYAADPLPIICQATWEGSILSQPKGHQGFGYDPLFWVADKNYSAAELDPDVKNQLSHRGQALRQLKEVLRDQIN